jgi:hypothetical protein
VWVVERQIWSIVANHPKQFNGDDLHPDPERSERVMKALLQTRAKIDMKSLEQAYEW